jgi:integrase/recombinase XerD
VLPATSSACSESTINRKLSAVTSFYEFHRRHGVEMALTIREQEGPIGSAQSFSECFMESTLRGADA